MEILLKVIILFCCFLSGCYSYAFDPNEYNQVVTIKLLAENQTEFCPNIDMKLKPLTIHFKEYEKYKIGNSEVYNSAIMLDEITKSLNYSMSEQYCRIKLKNIVNASEKILTSLGKL